MVGGGRVVVFVCPGSISVSRHRVLVGDRVVGCGLSGVRRVVEPSRSQRYF